MSYVQKLRRAIQTHEPFEVIKAKYDEAVRMYENAKTFRHPIHYAAQDGWPEMITVLVEKLGCDVNLVNNEGFTPFEIALTACRFSACKTLYGLGANIPENIPRKILKIFIEGGGIEMLNFVIYHRIINLSDVKKYLMQYYEELSPGMMELAIAVGCNINDQNNWSYRHRTPLMKYVRYRSNLECIKLFLAAGADISLLDAQGDTVLDQLNYYYNNSLFPPRNSKEVVKLLTEGVSKEYQLNFEKRIKHIQYLLDKRTITLFELLWLEHGISRVYSSSRFR